MYLVRIRTSHVSQHPSVFRLYLFVFQYVQSPLPRESESIVVQAKASLVVEAIERSGRARDPRENVRRPTEMCRDQMLGW